LSKEINDTIAWKEALYTAVGALILYDLEHNPSDVCWWLTEPTVGRKVGPLIPTRYSCHRTMIFLAQQLRHGDFFFLLYMISFSSLGNGLQQRTYPYSCEYVWETDFSLSLEARFISRFLPLLSIIHDTIPFMQRSWARLSPWHGRK